MRLSTQVKPISYVKANAAAIIDELADGGPPVVITKNGEAKAIVMDLREYEMLQERLAFLKILDLAERNIQQGKTRPVEDVVAELRRKFDLPVASA